MDGRGSSAGEGARRLARAAAVLLAVAGAGLVACSRSAAPPPAQAAADGAFKPSAEQWESLTLAPATVTPFEAAIHSEGRLAAADNRTAPVFAPVNGRVAKVFVTLGQAVAKGQPIAELDGVEFDQAAGDLTAAQAQVRAATASVRRLEQLAAEKAAAPKDLQQAQSDLATAEAAERSARGRLAALGLAPPREASGGQHAAYVLRAPQAGLVTQLSIVPGQAVASLSSGGAGTALAVVSDLSQLWLVGELREADARLARRGEPVEAAPTGVSGTPLHGKLDFISPTVDPVSRRVTVRATIANPGLMLRPETFVDFSLPTRPGGTALTVPAEAVIYDGGVAHVWLADARAHTLRLQAIDPGASAAGAIEVLRGLRPGDLVVSRGAIFVDQAAKTG